MSQVNRTHKSKERFEKDRAPNVCDTLFRDYLVTYFYAGKFLLITSIASLIVVSNNFSQT